MAIVGAVHLLALGFESHGSVPPDVLDRLHRLHGHGVIRVLDVLFVSRDELGVLGPEQCGADLHLSPEPPGSVLWQLLEGDSGDVESPAPPLELHSSYEVGLDLAAVESLAYRIEPGTSALLVLVETPWATDLLDAVVTAGGFPIVFGCLEPETMLVVGPQLATAAEARAAAQSSAAVHGIASLDALTSGSDALSTVAGDVLRTLVAARFIDPADVDDTISALADAGLVTPSTVEHDRLRRHGRKGSGT